MWKRRYWPVVAVVAVVGAIAGWIMWSNHQVWTDLDRSAEDFDVPPGFTELRRVRSGDAFCWVTCTNGGEAVLTVVFDPGTLTVDGACDAVEKAVRRVVEDAGSELEPPIGIYECDFSGPLQGTMRVAAEVALAEDLCTGCGDRWLEESEVPDLPVVAVVEFQSGIE